MTLNNCAKGDFCMEARWERHGMEEDMHAGMSEVGAKEVGNDVCEGDDAQGKFHGPLQAAIHPSASLQLR